MTVKHFLLRASPFVFFAFILTSCSLVPSEEGDGGLTNGVASSDSHDRFPIDAASIHAATTCNDCHGTFDTFNEFTCLGCHAHEEATTTSTHSGISGFAYDSNACYSCHPDGTGSGAGVNHETFFPISAGTKHEGIACATCHIDPNQRSVLGCATEACHARASTDSKHSGISGYAYDSTSCYACHPDGTADAASTVNHILIFPIATGSVHAAATCSDCHIDPANRKTVQCVDCHMSNGVTQHSQAGSSTQHTQVGGYLWANADCLDCHPDSNVERISTHLPFETQRTSVSEPGNTPKHYRRECRKCHDSDLANKPFAATDFNVYSCILCHNSGHTRGYNNVATTCTQSACHQNGWNP